MPILRLHAVTAPPTSQQGGPVWYRPIDIDRSPRMVGATRFIGETVLHSIRNARKPMAFRGSPRANVLPIPLSAPPPSVRNANGASAHPLSHVFLKSSRFPFFPKEPDLFHELTYFSASYATLVITRNLPPMTVHAVQLEGITKTFSGRDRCQESGSADSQWFDLWLHRPERFRKDHHHPHDPPDFQSRLWTC
ncbi:MAG UNVERIFIED_CONTAM: hypothetical protein LVR18_26675 [Planctomycetaceae bacterium]|jgi:hypothetical protein